MPHYRARANRRSRLLKHRRTVGTPTSGDESRKNRCNSSENPLSSAGVGLARHLPMYRFRHPRPGAARRGLNHGRPGHRAQPDWRIGPTCGRSRDRRSSAARARRIHERASVSGFRPGGVGHVRGVDARSRPEPARGAEGGGGLTSRPSRPRAARPAELRASNAAKLVLRSAFHHASRAGRQAIESADLVAAILDQSQEAPVMIVRRHGVEPDALVARVATHFRDSELREEQLRKQFELPAGAQELRREPEPAGAAGQARRP